MAGATGAFSFEFWLHVRTSVCSIAGCETLRHGELIIVEGSRFRAAMDLNDMFSSELETAVHVAQA